MNRYIYEQVHERTGTLTNRYMGERVHILSEEMVPTETYGAEGTQAFLDGRTVLSYFVNQFIIRIIRIRLGKVR